MLKIKTYWQHYFIYKLVSSSVLLENLIIDRGGTLQISYSPLLGKVNGAGACELKLLGLAAFLSITCLIKLFVKKSSVSSSVEYLLINRLHTEEITYSRMSFDMCCQCS